MRLLAALLLVPALWTAPARAEKAATGATVPRPADAAAKTAAKPSAPAGAPRTKASTEAEMLKAQKASAARDKAWDARTRSSMSSICKGC